jgi:hypothetical protein
MNEQLLRKLIRIKLEAGAYVLKEMPKPVQNTAYTLLTSLSQELQSHLEKKVHPSPAQNSKLTNITIQ